MRMEREMKQDAVDTGNAGSAVAAVPAQREQEVAVVTIVTKAPKGYRPRQSVSRWVVVTERSKAATRAAIDRRCREMAEDMEKEMGVRFKVSWTVAYVSGLIGISFLGGKAPAAVPQPSEEE